LGFEPDRHQTFTDGLADLDALAPTGLLRAEHLLHLRCELPAEGMPALFATVAGHPRLRLVSLMDHTPGIGQYADIPRWQALRRRDGLTQAAIDDQLIRLHAQRDRLRAANRRDLLATVRAAGHPLVLASHDDATAEEIAENHADGITISEFPVTLDAARAARAAGMQVIAGAPNLVRGGSHAGNVAAADLVRAGLVDAFASDYVPAALLEAAFAASRLGLSLPDAVALVTDRPARMAGLTDRGRIAPGLRADLVRVRVHDGLPVVRAVWRGGERVA
jgi:alpha-D-ribose 1-methylphosphonate 5-triphosphate diphosphatase